MPVTLACQDHLPAGTTLVERLTNLKSYGFDAVELLGSGLLDRLAETRSAWPRHRDAAAGSGELC